MIFHHDQRLQQNLDIAFFFSFFKKPYTRTLRELQNAIQNIIVYSGGSRRYTSSKEEGEKVIQ